MFKLCLVTDREQVPKGKSLEGIIKKSVKAGLNAVILREKDLNTKELFCLARKVKITIKDKCLFLVNSRLDIAMAINADGVHLGSTSVPVKYARKLIGKNKLIGVSCHNVKDAVRSYKEGADYVFIGPIYWTFSKAKYGQPLGAKIIRKIKNKIKIPVIAIGGIKKENVLEVLGNGAGGIAMISGIIKSKNVFKETKNYTELLNGFRK